MFRKPKPVAVNAAMWSFDTPEGRKTTRYEIPTGGKCVVGFGGDLILYDSSGLLRKRVDFQAGYTVELSFEY